jgi:hypothetical protein
MRPREPHPRSKQKNGGENDDACSLYEPRFEIVALLVDAHENEREPMDPSDPSKRSSFVWSQRV